MQFFLLFYYFNFFFVIRTNIETVVGPVLRDSKYLFSNYSITMWIFIRFHLTCSVSWQTSDWNKKYILLKYITTNQLRCSALFSKHIISTTERRWTLSPIFSGGKRKVYSQAYVFNNRHRLKIFPSDLYCCAIYLNHSPLFHK